jgi:hypothetical protein
VAPYADLGGLGTKQGPPVTFAWTMPNILPLLVPWLVMLVLLALPSNRNPRAWWIWAPLIGLALLAAGLEAAFNANGNEDLGYTVQTVVTASFGLAAIWLLGSALARRGRVVAIALLSLAFALVSFLALVTSPVEEELRDLSRWEPALFAYVLLFWWLSGLVFTGALNLTGWMSRRRFGGVRVSLRLLFWLWALWIPATAVLGLVVMLASGGRFEWLYLLLAASVLFLVSFALLLPFLILSFTNAFYRDRLKALLRLPAESVPSLPPAAAPVAVQDGAP